MVSNLFHNTSTKIPRRENERERERGEKEQMTGKRGMGA